MSTFPLPSAVRRSLLVATLAVGTVLAVAGPAAAHVEVTASDERALAKDVTLTFTSEAESDTAGIAKLQIVLPEGIAPDAVKLKKAPDGWKLTPGERGYTIGGKALATGTDVVHSITVTQLPDVKSLVFKTVETYGDGKIDRWIEVPKGAQEPENPAPVLTLKPAAPGSTPINAGSSPTPSKEPSKASPAPLLSQQQQQQSAAKKKDDGGGSGVVVAVAAVVVVIAAGVGLWWFKRRPGAGSA
ncbi:DUF1775 domain-containing protein [Streptomyces sp. NPDC060064]|uniref:DUF1775 domain-containing protein n=1 Tax=Streptomyces sp. NPDC060064 TaxID=3347049 RepID=UPI003686C3C0